MSPTAQRTEEHVLARFKAQIARADPILFLGAGFSTDASNAKGEPIPSASTLTKALWDIAFSGEEFEESTALGDIYHAAASRNPRAVLGLIRERLSVAAERLPAYYQTWFATPWARCYTLNIDDVDLAVARRFDLPRPVRALSATSLSRTGSGEATALEVIHLNGVVGDPLNDLTFSELDYARRQVNPDQWFAACANDILSRPVVFVGTSLHEPMLWQYIEHRRRGVRVRGLREMRPGSYFVAPSLNQARRVLLEDLNIDWIQMSAREFGEQVLPEVTEASVQGHASIRIRSQTETRQSRPPLLSELTAGLAADEKTDYLLGQEPQWSDILSGRAIARECDRAIYDTAIALLSSGQVAVPLTLTGTAGSGTSTSLMRLGLRLSAEGTPVYWVDSKSNIDPYRLRQVVSENDGRVCIAVDDADSWGNLMSGWARDLPAMRPGVLLVAGLRSTRVDGILDSVTLGGITPIEISMPHLTDSDIADLLRVLDADSKLGVLAGLTESKRVGALRDQAGRQLLVAMIQATSGRLFADKAIQEFIELSGDAKQIYASLCLVASQRYTMDRDEILLALGGGTNETLNTLERLVQRHLVARRDAYSGYSARHRMIAETVVAAPEFRDSLDVVLDGVCWAFSNKVRQNERNSRSWRRLIRFINHDFLLRMVGLEAARGIYERVEPVLTREADYWLQRGSLEVEEGDLARAKLSLNTARGLAPDSRNIEVEYDYLLMKEAIARPEAPEATEIFEEARRSLEAIIAAYGRETAHPYHVLGSQGLAWARRGMMSTEDQRQLLGFLAEIVEQGARNHPRNLDLARLARDVRRAWLLTATKP